MKHGKGMRKTTPVGTRAKTAYPSPPGKGTPAKTARGQGSAGKK